MGSKGGARAIKRYAAPAEWPVYKKQYKWVMKPSPGPHPIEDSLPLLVVLRDLMHLAFNAHEVRVALNAGRIRVNGRVQRRPDFPVGVMDLVSVPDADIYVRIIPFKGKLVAHPVPVQERDLRLLRIEDKTCIRGFKVQLNLTGGVNISVPVEGPQGAKTLPYSTMDTLKTDAKGTKIAEHLKLDKGSYVLAVKGKNSGEHGVLEETVQSLKRRKALVRVKKSSGEVFETIVDYVYAVGNGSPEISLPEVA
ncbi:MAG: 30S ribosomal protein S4e [Thermoprotei archaeon]